MLKVNSPDKDIVDFGANRLRTRYIIALMLLATLIVVSQWVIQRSLALQEHDSRVVNIAGRQRMLSQRITKTGYYLLDARTTEARHDYQGQLRDALNLWQRAHLGLQHGDDELGLPGDNSPRIVALFQSIEHEFQEMVAAGQEASNATADPERLTQAVGRLSDHEAAFLNGMDAIVFQYDSEAKQKVDNARRLEFGLAAFTLLVLYLEARFIFAPAVRRLRLEMRRHQQHESDMERLFSTSPTAMFLMDGTTLNIIRGNGKAEILMGCSATGFLGRPVTDFLDTKYEANNSFMEKIRAGEVLNEYEILLINARRHIVEALASCCRINYSGQPAYVIGATDITEIKKAQQTLEYYATFDEMTGLVNRRTGLLMLATELDRAKRDDLPLTVCFADLDGLKAINDQYGHHEGDWTIHTVAMVLSDSIRGGDVALRLGGDEFLLILHDCDEPQGKQLVERVEQRLARIVAEEPRPYRLSASFGIAVYDPQRHQAPEDLIADADARMYEAKHAKRMAASRAWQTPAG
ncbi:MAG: diguanylate cyclase [Gammaproteobacteria bacterium]|nr:diguanylate cyclase [Gammaproteobacteria bacterium]MBU1416752.1 diguanylate cyclase [Gammaproteobacteria bacterium]